MPDLNQIRGISQVKPKTIPASAMDAQFAESGGDLFVDKEDHSSECDGLQRSFVFGVVGGTGTAILPVVGSEHVFLRGLLRADGYTMDGAILTFDVAPLTDDELVFSYRKLIV